jgi:hypothetical protein
MKRQYYASRASACHLGSFPKVPAARAIADPGGYLNEIRVRTRDFR